MLLQGVAYYRELTSGSRHASYAAYEKITSLNAIGAFLMKIGYPVDALRVYGEILGAAADLQEARAYPRVDAPPWTRRPAKGSNGRCRD